MNHKVLLFALAVLLPAVARAQYRYAYPEDREPAAAAAAPEKAHPRGFRYYYALGGGVASPVGGEWGGNKAGFKSSPSWTFAVGKKVDDVLSYGLESSFDTGHKSRASDGLEVGLFSFTPFLRAARLRGAGAYYAVLGAGIYHWSQPAFGAGAARRPSDSGISLGVSLGVGALYPFSGAMRLGLDLRWHHVFSVSGVNFYDGPVNNITPSLMLCYGLVQENRK